MVGTWGTSGVRQDSVESDGKGDHEGQRDEGARDRAQRPQSAIPLSVPLLGSRFLELCPSGFRVQGSGFRVQGSGFRVQDSGFRVQGSGFRVQGSGFLELC